jgi:tetratricopeptide (TPR) repeat protein
MPDVIQKGSRKGLVVYLLLAGITLAVYGQAANHDFVSYDDPLYVTQNSHVQAGLTWHGVFWAFTTGHASNWHPMTWLSHMLDVEIFGLNPGGHHLTNIVFHLANAGLLFFVLQRITGAFWRSATVSALFCLHPLHVESVAWVAERKDVLSTFFWLLTMVSYARFVEKRGPGRYALVIILFALGLMAKPMVVTLPFVLLLFDYWPLGRFDSPNLAGDSLVKKTVSLVREKIPLFLMAGASCVVTFLVQQHGPAVQSLDQIPMGVRLTNALVAYATYGVKTIWPHGLAVHYPHPMGELPVWQIAGSALLLIVVSGLFAAARKNHPYLVVGWLWFLGTLVPVIGIVQVGGQAMADRYTYIPMVGLLIAVVWGFAAIREKWRAARKALPVMACLIIAAFAIGTWFQVRHWKNSAALFEHALRVTKDNQLAHNQLGQALHEAGRVDEAIKHFEAALRITPQYVNAHVNLGDAFKDQGKLDDAARAYGDALHFVPGHATAKNNLGVVLAMQGKMGEAIALFSQVLEADPENVRAHNNLGIVLAQQGKFEEATHHFREALRIDPRSESARKNLQRVLERRDHL